MSDGSERRRDKRMDLSVQVDLNRIDKSGQPPIPIEILDLSRAGIGFTCKEDLANGGIYQANIRIWTGDVIPAFINVVRVNPHANNTVYGGIFVGMPESEWVRISVYEQFKDHEGQKN